MPAVGSEFSARVNIKTPGTLTEPGVIAGTFLIVSVFAFHRPGGRKKKKLLRLLRSLYNPDQYVAIYSRRSVSPPPPRQLASNEGCAPPTTCCEDRHGELTDLLDQWEGNVVMHVRIYVQSYGIRCK